MSKDFSRKKVLIYISNLEVGGAQNMVYELVRKITNYDIEILCHSERPNNHIAEKLEKLCKITFLNFKGKTTFSIIFNTLKAISKIRPDVIHCHLGTVANGIIWCILHRKKCVVTVHTKPKEAFNRINELMLKVGLSTKMTTVVAVSKENLEECKKYYRSNNIELINNGIDFYKYKKVQHPIFTFIHVARQDKNKNASFIIDCFKKVLDSGIEAKLLLVGDGVEHINLLTKVQTLNLSNYVKFTGNVPNTEYYYSISDCFLLASHREALPLTCLEALATGIPIISTNVGGIKDIVTNNGYLIQDGDFENYCSAMINVIKHPIKNIDSFSKIIGMDFSSELMAKKYENIYSK